MDDTDFNFPAMPDLVMIKEYTYVRPANIDYLSFTKDEEGDLGKAVVMYNSQNGITIDGVAEKDFKRVADNANAWYLYKNPVG